MIFDYILGKCKEEGKRRDQEWNKKGRYVDLDNTPFLYSSAELKDMAKNSKTLGQLESIIDHLHKHDTHGIGSYDEIEWSIINRYWDEHSVNQYKKNRGW
jgi:hypothetical protein